jgi:hypothetical protein
MKSSVLILLINRTCLTIALTGCSTIPQGPTAREIPAASVANTSWVGRTYNAALTSYPNGPHLREGMVRCEVHFNPDGTFDYYDSIDGKIVGEHWEQHNSELKLSLGNVVELGMIADGHIVGTGVGTFPRKYTWWLIQANK